MINPGIFRSQPASLGLVHLDPAKFYAVCDLIKGFDTSTLSSLEAIMPSVDAACTSADEEVDDLAKIIRSIEVEQRRNTKRNPFAAMDDDGDGEDPFSAIRSAAPGENFLQVFFDVISALQIGFHGMRDIARGIRPEALLMTESRNSSRLLNMNGERMQQMMFEISLNEPVVQRFISAVLSAEASSEAIVLLGNLLTQKLDRYHQLLLRRHSVEGIQIHGDSPVTTDVALTIFENVDASGEIQDGKNPDEISAYSAHKAEIIANAAKIGLIGDFVRNPDELIKFIKDRLSELQALSLTVTKITSSIVGKLRTIIGPQLRKKRSMSSSEFDSALDYLDVLNPQDITYREKTGLLTAEERFSLNFKNETLKRVVSHLGGSTTTKQLVEYILKRKAELRDYYRDENSFYVCKISAGNPFGGKAPGELEVIPGTRPVVNMDEVIGSGFDEIKGFIGQVETASKWHELFLATSPSRTADKSNVLMVGPMGCGKSEVLRAVGGDKKSIGIFASGSDFLTCWKGEAEKNPKRLFEAANKLQRESRKHVHILIDEIDSVLNSDRGHESFGGTQLVTEFQNLMDGVVHYQNLSIWGATNVVERIPMPMIRRFSKVIVVGELDQKDRIKLLKNFASFMPLDDIKDWKWEEFGTKLNGATGDVIRKVIDYVWRSKMTWFIQNHQLEAEKVRDFLGGIQGQKFSLADFTSKQRDELHARLKPFVCVHFSDIENSISLALENVAVLSEIETAKATYANAKAFLAHMRAAKTIKAQTDTAEMAQEKR